MIDVAQSQDLFFQDASVSSVSREVGRPVWQLMRIGWENGLSTSLTEMESIVPSDAIAKRFQRLAKAWRDECAHLSSMREMALHPAYQQIIGMGLNALPFIFAELEREPNHWFWALRAITGEDPVVPDHRGSIRRMAQDWLQWAKKRGIRP